MNTVEPFLDEKNALSCVHCGLCLSSCPTYLETGNENDSPRGRIYLMRAVQDGRLPVEGTAVHHLDRCLGCRACEAVCPSGVPYGDLLETTRDHVERKHRRSLFQRLLRRVLIERIFPHPNRLQWALLPARLLKVAGGERWLPRFIRESLSLIPDDASRAALPEVSPARGRTSQGRVGMIGGCVMSVLFGKTNQATVTLLNETGFDVVHPADQGCCGALFAHGGNLARARECARQNIAAFEDASLEAIIINAAGCGSTLKEYGHLLKDDPDWAERGAQFSRKVMDLTEWLSRHSAPPEPGNDHPRVTYHDACHLAHPQGITKPPRDLIQQRAGSAYVELPESDICCGSAGSYNLTEPAMAERLQKRKIEHILKTGAEIVVTTNPGCLLQIQAGLRKAGATHVRAVHIADYLVTQT